MNIAIDILILVDECRLEKSAYTFYECRNKKVIGK